MAFPLSWRKFSLTALRVQEHPARNKRLAQELEILRAQVPNQVVIPGQDTFYNLDQLVASLALITTSPYICSVFSYLLRAELFSAEDVEGIRHEGILKEVTASLQMDALQVLDYRCLYADLGIYKGKGLYHETSASGKSTSEAWRKGIKSLKSLYESQAHIFIPHYNRKKNCGYITQQNLSNSLSQDGFHSLDSHDITPLRLMKAYHANGTQIKGPMEMRFAWRYSDLKGRTYYATGGDCFWPGLYIKQIAKDILSLLPSSHPHSRYDASRVTYTPLGEGEIIITYDYSSFTTNLAELKYFLNALSIMLEDVVIRALDIYEGIIEINLGEYIRGYNESINCHASYDTTRVDLCELSTILVQTRSGMLGAQGNIAFSTLLHALSAGAISDDPGETCVVGDDALMKIWDMALDTAISRINLLGTVAKEKTHTWENFSMYDPDFETARAYQGFQFLKRPLNIDGFGQITTGTLPSFPSICDALGMEDEYHISSDRTRAQRLKTFLMQWGRFLTQLTRKNPELSEDEIILMLAPIQSVYRHYDVPFEGLPIGSEIVIRTKGTHPETLTTSFIVPPCTEDVFFEHWVSLHIRYYKGSIVSIPMLVNFSMPPGPCFGLGHYIEQCTLHRLQILMADLDYFKIDMVLRQVVLSDESESELIDWVTGFGPRRTVHSIYCIKEPPMWYNDIIADEGPE
jgi:hypothetical protein